MKSNKGGKEIEEARNSEETGRREDVKEYERREREREKWRR